MKSTVEPIQVSERPARWQAWKSHCSWSEKSHSWEGVGCWVSSASVHLSPDVRPLFLCTSLEKNISLLRKDCLFRDLFLLYFTPILIFVCIVFFSLGFSYLFLLLHTLPPPLLWNSIFQGLSPKRKVWIAHCLLATAPFCSTGNADFLCHIHPMLAAGPKSKLVFTVPYSCSEVLQRFCFPFSPMIF